MIILFTDLLINLLVYAMLENRREKNGHKMLTTHQSLRGRFNITTKDNLFTIIYILQKAPNTHV